MIDKIREMLHSNDQELIDLGVQLLQDNYPVSQWLAPLHGLDKSRVTITFDIFDGTHSLRVQAPLPPFDAGMINLWKQRRITTMPLYNMIVKDPTKTLKIEPKDS